MHLMRPIFAVLTAIIVLIPDIILAVDCGIPVTAPTYNVGEKWTWRLSNGKDSTFEIIRVEGDSAWMEWDKGDIRVYDKDWIIRRVIRKNGEEVTSQSARYPTVGQAVLSFPLTLDKSWSYYFFAQPSRSSASNLGQIAYRRWSQVLACEDVQVPAGKDSALKIKITENWAQGSTGSGTFFLWYAPDAKYFIQSKTVQNGWWKTPVDHELLTYEKH